MVAHPLRRLRDSSRMEIKCGTHTDQQGRIESTLVLGHPALLFWRPQPHPNDIGASFVNPRDLFLVFCLRQRPVWWATDARCLQTRESRCQPGGKFLGNSRGAAVEEMAISFCGGLFAETLQ